MRLCTALLATLALMWTLNAPAQTNAQAVESVRKADQDWLAVFAAKDVDKSVAFCAPDGAVMSPGAPAAQGPEAIRAMFSGFFQLPELKMSWTPTTVKVAKSGDMAFTSGTYHMTFKDASGKTATDNGKYVTVWTKQPDGSWKVERDIFNSDAPQPGQ